MVLVHRRDRNPVSGPVDDSWPVDTLQSTSSGGKLPSDGGGEGGGGGRKYEKEKSETFGRTPDGTGK